MNGDNRYRTPNGKVATEEQLQAKYGDKLEGLIANETFSVIEENTFATPNGTLESESVLRERYGDRFDTLLNENTISLDFTFKKKEETEPSSSSNGSLESSTGVQENSSESIQNKPSAFVQSILDGEQDERIEQLGRENDSIQKIRDDKFIELDSRFRQSISLTEEEEAEIDSQIQEEEGGDFGFFGNIGNFFRNTPTINLGTAPVTNPFFNPEKAGNNSKKKEIREAIAKQLSLIHI